MHMFMHVHARVHTHKTILIVLCQLCWIHTNDTGPRSTYEYVDNIKPSWKWYRHTAAFGTLLKRYHILQTVQISWQEKSCIHGRSLMYTPVWVTVPT